MNKPENFSEKVGRIMGLTLAGIIFTALGLTALSVSAIVIRVAIRLWFDW